MKKRKFLSLACAFLFGVSLFGALPSRNAKAESISDFDCEYSVGTREDPFTSNIYGCKEIITYTEEEGLAAGLPEGFSGTVLSVGESMYSDPSNRGVTLDFSAQKIPTYMVESITFRVYVADDGKPSDGYPEVRIPMPYVSGGWVMRYPFSDKTDQWYDIVLKNGNDSFFENAVDKGFSAVSKDGYLHKFELSVRHNGATAAFYIDSVKVGLIANDGVAPVIAYDGEDVVTISQGQAFPFSVSAKDELDGNVDVEYVWGDATQLDEQGNPKIGTHTLTFKASDYFGNVAEKTITLIVEEADVIAPTLSIQATTLRVKIGTIPMISVTATDDKDETVNVVYVWSDGALDGRGKLTEGTHTLTVSASDLSGNKTESALTFIVTADGNTNGEIIDEEILCPDISEEPEIPPTSEEPEVPPASEEPEIPPTSEEPEVPPTSEEPEIPPTSEEPELPPTSEEPEVPPTSEEPEAPPTSEAPSKKKKGCGSAIGGMAIAASVATMLGVLAKKRED